MEEDKAPEQRVRHRSPTKSIIKRASTYAPNNLYGLGDKKKRKKVMFVDRAKNLSLCTIFNYEQTELVEINDDNPGKSTSCACRMF
jgi:hypothetical protein